MLQWEPKRESKIIQALPMRRDMQIDGVPDNFSDLGRLKLVNLSKSKDRNTHYHITSYYVRLYEKAKENCLAMYDEKAETVQAGDREVDWPKYTETAPKYFHALMTRHWV
jgi:hypothetical protein